MVTVYSPESSLVRFLSSREPVSLNKVVLSAYFGSTMVLEMVEVIMEDPFTAQETEEKGSLVGLIVVVNVVFFPWVPYTRTSMMFPKHRSKTRNIHAII